MKNPWETHPHIWKTKAAFFSFVRGGLRKALWDRYPIKLEYKKANLIPPPESYTGRGKSGQYCALSGEFIINSKLEVDHIEGNQSLNDWDDIQPFIEHLLLCQDGLQLVGKEAHKVKSYAERMGISYKEAAIRKKVIAETKGSVASVKRKLSRLGATQDQLKNAKTRQAFMLEYLQNQEN